jgi:hypothetical protein
MAMPMLLLLVGLSIAHAAEPTGTMTLACEGKTHEITQRRDDKTEPISMGIIVDFAARTVEGFGSDATFRIGIEGITETTINFSGSNVGDTRRDYTYHVNGTIDRVTGAVQAVHSTTPKAAGQTWSTSYSLKCKPTQRMF